MTETLSTDLIPTDARVLRDWLSNSEVEETFPWDWASDAGQRELMEREDSFALAFDAWQDEVHSEWWGLDLG